MTLNKTNKLWGSAFSQEPEKAVIAFTAGRDVASVPPADVKLIPYDLWVNKAHCLMLFKQGIIGKEDAQVIFKGLLEIEELTKQGKFTLDPAKEDVHSNIESWLTEKYGIEHAGKLHTARSRNDQICTDMKLYMKDQAFKFAGNTVELAKTLISESQKYQDYVMPGFTHHQHAMVTNFGHVLQGFSAMMVKDCQRFINWLEMHNTGPLGASVAYGTMFPIDNQLTVKLLGFTHPVDNSMEAITNRGEAEADLAYSIGQLMNHLSGLAQTLILMATPEFGMVKLADKFSTGSSIMPQKKNPDPLEVIKAKASLAHGMLVSLMGIGKGSFIGYNRDTQWTKYLIMDLVDECLPAATVMKGVVTTMQVNQEAMVTWAKKGFIGATSLLEKLSSEFKLPFRLVKVVVEKAVKYSQGDDKVNYAAIIKSLKEQKLDVPITRKAVRIWQDPVFIINNTLSFGGPSKQALNNSSEMLISKVKLCQKQLQEYQKQIGKAQLLLSQEIKEVLKKGGEQI